MHARRSRAAWAEVLEWRWGTGNESTVLAERDAGAHGLADDGVG